MEVLREASTGRSLWRVAPQRGRALLFSSGLENVHYVDALSEGTRFALATFFGTVPEGEAGAEDLAFKLCEYWDPQSFSGE